VVTARAKKPCRIAARADGARCWGTKGSGPTYEVRAAEGMGMTPGEIRACYRLYAAHRKSHEICAFPGTIPAASNAGNLDDLAVLLRLQTGLEELVRDIGHRDPNDDLRPALTRSLGQRRSRRSLPSCSVAALWWGAEVIGVVGSSKMGKLRSR